MALELDSSGSAAIVRALMGGGGDARAEEQRRIEAEESRLLEVAKLGDSKLFDEAVAAFARAIPPQRVDFMREMVKFRQKQAKEAEAKAAPFPEAGLQLASPQVTPPTGVGALSLPEVIARLQSTRSGLEQRGLSQVEAEQGLQQIDTSRAQALATQREETQKTAVERARELRTERFGNEDQLRDEHRQLSGEFIEQRNAFDRVLASAKNPSPEGDFALIFNFMKVLDPSSVVREGEFANAENAPGVPARIRTIFNRLQGNPEGTLPPEVRKSFVERSRLLFAEARRRQRELDREFVGLAKRNRLEARNVVIPFLRRPPLELERAAKQASPGAEFSHIEPGGAAVFVRPDGTAFEVAP